MNRIRQNMFVLIMTLSFCFMGNPPVTFAENPVTPQQEGWTIIEKEIPYGDGPREVMANAKEGSQAAPSSFTVDDAGNIFILDRMNERIQVFSNNLDFVRSIPLPGESRAGQDLVVDNEGNFYILNPNWRQIEQYDSNGAPVTSIKLDPQRWNLIYGLPMYLRGNKLYIKTFNIAGIERAFVPVGKIMNGKLESLAPDEKDAIIDGYLLPSGRQFKGNAGKEAVITDIDGSKKPLRSASLIMGKGSLEMMRAEIFTYCFLVVTK